MVLKEEAAVEEIGSRASPKERGVKGSVGRNEVERSLKGWVDEEPSSRLARPRKSVESSELGLLNGGCWRSRRRREPSAPASASRPSNSCIHLLNSFC
jgi:hypothetical protein